MLPNALRPSATDHVPVLADEVRRLLDVQPGDTVVDATFGAGGHAELLAARPARQGPLHRHRPRSVGTRVLRALPQARRRARRGSCAASSRPCSTSWRRTTCVSDAILLDLGVSSMQLDRPERGFSYAVDAPLDMRMDPSADETAADIVNDAPERELQEIFRRYGEERYARQIARAISRRRRREPFERTGELVDTIKAAIPTPARFGEGHPAKRVFQALRIAVNDELGQLEDALPAAIRAAAAARPGRRHQLPLARGPHRQAVLPRRGARLRLPAGLPGLRVRRAIPSLRVLTPRAVRPERPGGGTQPALSVSAASRGREGADGSCCTETRPAESPRPPAAKAPPRAAQRKLAGGIVWIVVVGGAARRASWRSTSRCCGSTSSTTSSARSGRSCAPRTPRCPRSLRAPGQRPYPEARGRGARSCARVARADDIRRSSAVMRARRQSDRRIRLLLVLLLLVFGAHTRARDVAADGARGRPQPARVEPAAADGGDSRLGGDDRRSHGRAARDRPRRRSPSTPNPRQVHEPARGALAAAKTLGVDADVLYPQLLDKSKGFIYIMRKADPEQREGAASGRHLAGVGFLTRGAARVSAGRRGCSRARLRGHRQPRPRRARAAASSACSAAATAARRSSRIRSAASSTSSSRVPERPGRDVFLTIDHTIQANVESVLRSTVSQWGAARATAVVLDAQSGRRPRDGASRPASTRTSTRGRRRRSPSQRCGHGHVRAGVDVQARDRGGGALGGARQRKARPFTLPYSIQVADRVVHDAEPRGTETMTVAPDPVALIERRRDHACAVARPAAARSLDRRFGFGQADGNRLPGRDARHRAAGRALVRLDDRQRPYRPGHRGHAVQMAAAYAAVANGGMWIAPHLVDHVSGGRHACGRSAAACSPRRSQRR